MKLTGFLALLITSIILISCESYKDSVLSADNSNKTSDNPRIQLLETGIDLIDLDDVVVVNQAIDGVTGGTINIDTVLTDSQGNALTIYANLKFDPNSFSDVRVIRMIANPNYGSVQFFPEMTFNKPVKLSLFYSGINLSNLGFTQNSLTQFVYINNAGITEPIENNLCIINWQQQSLMVSNARLLHFSRYVFVRKSN